MSKTTVSLQVVVRLRNGLWAFHPADWAGRPGAFSASFATEDLAARAGRKWDSLMRSNLDASTKEHRGRGDIFRPSHR